MTTPARVARRRASILLAGAVALSVTGCTLIGGTDEPTSTSSTQVPLTTTTTSEPSTSSSTSDGGGSKNPPSGDSVLQSSRNYMNVSSNVTISGTLHDDERDLDVTLRSEGSTGGLLSTSKSAGVSRATLTVPGGGRMDAIMIGIQHYAKVNLAWLDVNEVPKDSPLRKNLDRWVKVPFDNSPLDPYRPQQLLKGTFFGKSLTPFDAKRSPASFEELAGKETYRVAIRQAGKEGGMERIVWISTDAAAPVPIKLTYGQNDQRSTLNFSRWNTTREDFAKPPAAKTVEDLGADDL